MYELVIATNPKKTANLYKRINDKRLKSKNEGKDKTEYNDTENAYLICAFMYWIWLFTGFFTSQWIIFIFLLLIGFITPKHYIFRCMNGIISSITILFIILNVYHLDINVYQLLVNYVSTIKF